GVRVRRVAVDYASHTRHVEAVEEVLAAELAGVTALAPEIPFYSSVDGTWIGQADVLDAGYWYRNLRHTVGFEPAVRALIGEGFGVFVEVSPHPVLLQPVSEIADTAEVTPLLVGSLRRGEGGMRRMLTSLAEAFVRGVDVDWTAVMPTPYTRHQLDLPTYAFAHEHYWIQRTKSATPAGSFGQTESDHPLLGAVVELPQSDGLVFTSRWSLRTHSWLADHAVHGAVLVPGAAFVDLAIRAGDEFGCEILDELVTDAPLVLPEEGSVRVHVAVGGEDPMGRRSVAVYSSTGDARDAGQGGGQEWTRHAYGTLSPEAPFAGAGAGAGADSGQWPPAGAEPVDLADLSAVLAKKGYVHGPAFQGLRAVWRRGEELFAEAALAQDQRPDAGLFGLHPALLDAATQPALSLAGSDDETPLLSAWHDVVLHAEGATSLRIMLTRTGSDTLSFAAVDETGTPVLRMRSVAARPVSAEQVGAAAVSGDRERLPEVRVRRRRPTVQVAVSADERRALADRLETLPAAERRELLLDVVRTQIAAVLGYATADRLGADQGLFEIGFDSLIAMQLRNRLAELSGTKLPSNVVFEYPTPSMLAAFLHERTTDRLAG
ncbi:acyltransferase domain-containing protein, partial [Streptomyces sp. NPDC058534]|uniref:acyltransferase domain-containing protein n=1 Tax=Streptomyces sp. NPDC058534 TaxID=3346541 RepID=UPI003669782F